MINKCDAFCECLSPMSYLFESGMFRYFNMLKVIAKNWDLFY